MKLKTNTAKCSQCMKKFGGRGTQNTRERKYVVLKICIYCGEQHKNTSIQNCYCIYIGAFP